MIDVFPCPRCGRRLERSGVVGWEDELVPVFQCDDCVVTVPIFGEPVEVTLTFAVDAAGRAFDPSTPDGSLPLGDGDGPFSAPGEL